VTSVGTFRMLFAGLCICSSATLLRADVVAETVQNLGLSFTSSAGSVVFLGSNEATSFGMVSDSFSGMSQQTESGKGATTVSVTTPVVFVNTFSAGGATATASTNAPTLTSDNLAVAELFAVPGSAAAKATSTLTGSFEIMGTSAPASLNVFASLQVVENFAEADVFGLSASTEAIFSLSLSNGDKPVAFDNLVSVGPDQQKEFSVNETLTGSAMLLPGTPYSFTAVEESDASVTNGAALPEPSYLFLSIMLLSGLLAARAARSRFRSAGVLVEFGENHVPQLESPAVHLFTEAAFCRPRG
jgi:hypothetical protein